MYIIFATLLSAFNSKIIIISISMVFKKRYKLCYINKKFFELNACFVDWNLASYMDYIFLNKR